MPKAEAGSAKAIGNAMKARGLTKLRFYCQVCEKANRDEHAYKMHCESESHMRQLSLVAQNPNKVIDDFSRQFQDEFVSLLSRRFGTRRIKANQVYQEYIAERHHLHMNATRWMSLTEFVKHLGKEGIVHVDENEQGWFISWVDNSPEALKRQAALQKMERAKMDDEGRERKRLKEQIRSANEARGGEQDSASPQPTQIGLNRDASAGPIRLGIGTSGGGGANKPESSSPPAATQVAASKPSFSISTSTSTSSSAGAASGKPFKANPLKSSANPLKSSAPPPSSSSSSSRAAQPRTMAERIRLEEEERRKRKMTGPMPAANGGGPGGGVKRIRM